MRIPRRDIFEYDTFFHVFSKFNSELTMKEDELEGIQEIVQEEELASPEIKIVASNILKNHYHLLLSVDKEEYEDRLPDEKRLGISVFMQKINTRISIYVNKVKDRHGKVFYDRFKSRMIDCIKYFNNVFEYITNNAMKHYKVVKEKWKYSSFHFYNKTKDWMQGFLVRMEDLVEKIYGVRPDIGNPLNLDYTTPYPIDDI